MKLLVLSVCLVLMTAFSAVDVSARPRCPKVWVEGHYNHHGRWVRPHWKRSHWVRGHHDRAGRWIPGHCR